ncbi:helix-turn-helix domain-containing protein [Plantactinospora sp. GCM10030261]|uniref:helix-turn-helix domain-containing protein n=1 Tax=Plantactinospora sp. GCM10030261 TaxID=3273420 RepID=UPI00360C021E
MDQSSTTVPRRQLGHCLQRLRDKGNLSVRMVSEAVGWSRQKLWRIERGAGSVRPADVRRLCELYQAPAELTASLTELARQPPGRSWWQAYPDVGPDRLDPYPMMEAEATRLRCYDAELVPVLLRTPAYTAEVLRAERPDQTGRERSRLVARDRWRQRVLHRRGPTAPRLEFLLSEAALRRPVVDHPAMVGQLSYLVAVNELPTVRVRVLPLAAGPHPGSACGNFTLLDFAGSGRRLGGPSVVRQEGPTGALYLDRSAEVNRYQEIWAGMAALALSERESGPFIASFAGVRG